MIRKHLKTIAISLFLVGLLVAGPLAAEDLSADWKISGPFGGTATTIAVDPHNPQTVLAGALDTLLYRSEDAGTTWTRLEFPPRHLGEITSILIDPSDSNHYLVGVLDAFDGGLYESLDRGASWKPVPNMSDCGVRALTASKSDPSEFVAGTLRGVMLSKDSGKTWQRISDLDNLEMRGITSVAIDPSNPNVIYAGTSHLPWKTTDLGKNWQSIHEGMIDDSDVFSIYIDPKNPSDVYASACSGIYASSNAGELWKKIAGIPNTSRRTHVIRLDPTQTDTIFAGTTAGLYQSTNSGTTWRTLTGLQVNSLVFDPAQPQVMYLAMLYAGLGKSNDGGQVIQPINDGFVDRYINGLTHSGSQLVAFEEQEGETTGIFTSVDAGGTWTPINNPRGLDRVHLRSIVGGNTSDHVLLGASVGDVYKSEDKGASWKALPLKVVSEQKYSVAVRHPATKHRRATITHETRTRKIIRSLRPNSVGGLWSVPEGDKDAVYLAANDGLFKTSDWGVSWVQVTLPGAMRVDSVFAGNNGSTPLFVKTSGGVFLSSDHGASWEPLNLPRPVSDVNEIAANTDGSHLLLATTAGLYTSADAGKTWSQNSNGIPLSTVTSVVFATDEVAYSSEFGQLYRSEDSGQHWQLVPTRLNELVIRQLWCPARGRLYAITNGTGILFRDNVS